MEGGPCQHMVHVSHRPLWEQQFIHVRQGGLATEQAAKSTPCSIPQPHFSNSERPQGSCRLLSSRSTAVKSNIVRGLRL